MCRAASEDRRGGRPYLTLRSAFRGGLPEGQFKIHPLLNYIVFRIPGAASGMVSRKMTLGQLVLQRSAFQGSFSEGVPVKWPKGNSFCRVPRSGGAAALEGGWVRKKRSAHNTTIVKEGSGLKAGVPPY